MTSPRSLYRPHVPVTPADHLTAGLDTSNPTPQTSSLECATCDHRATYRAIINDDPETTINLCWTCLSTHWREIIWHAPLHHSSPDFAS